MEPYKIVLGPVITERSQKMRDDENKYVFRVAAEANKIEIGRAVEAIFGKGQKNFKVEKVRIMKMRGKLKRLGMRFSRTSDWKKAIVTLGKDSKIDMFES